MTAPAPAGGKGPLDALPFVLRVRAAAETVTPHGVRGWARVVVVVAVAVAAGLPGRGRVVRVRLACGLAGC